MILKFRAWDKEFKEMVQVNALLLDDQAIMATYKNGSVTKEDMKSYVLMQSTGLKDDFDKEIFEGDVILWTYWDEFEDSGRAKIVFDKGMFKLLDIHTGKEAWDSLFDCIENCNVYLQGNVYETPELKELVKE
jgi:hypothetical protein